MAKNVTVNYNGEALKEDEVLVLMPYDEEDVRINVTHRENIVVVTIGGVATRAVLKAVPRAYEREARAQFNAWQRSLRPQETEGRCLVPQADGTVKECPKKCGDNRVGCAECPHRGEYERRVTAPVSLEQQRDSYDWEPAAAEAADAAVMAEEELTESQRRIADKFLEMLEKSPKHCLAMILMGLGCKGEEFADRMHLKHDAANRVRNQVLGTADDGITDFDGVDVEGFSAHRVGDTEYYRTEAKKALDTLLKLYF